MEEVRGQNLRMKVAIKLLVGSKPPIQVELVLAPVNERRQR